MRLDLIDYMLIGLTFLFLFLANRSLAADGHVVFTSYCQSCHGAGGEGDGPAGRYMEPKPRNFRKDAFKRGERLEEVENTIRNGIPNTAMPAFQSLPQDELEAVAKYILSLRGK